MPRPWQEQFDFYLAPLSSGPLAVNIDMAAAEHAPLSSHPKRLSLRVTLKQPRSDGLVSREEYDALCAVEDALIAALGRACDALYLGRVVTGGQAYLTFYLPESAADRAVEAAARDVKGVYGIGLSFESDPTWQFYFETMFPDPYQRAAMGSRAVLIQLEENGDDGARPRSLDHFAWFGSQEQAVAAATGLSGLGFQVDPPRQPDSSAPIWSLAFHREDALSEGRIDAVTADVVELVLAQEGEYDGWGCPVTKAP
jgi:regulator of RNase E activity RraB